MTKETSSPSIRMVSIKDGLGKATSVKPTPKPPTPATPPPKK